MDFELDGRIYSFDWQDDGEYWCIVDGNEYSITDIGNGWYTAMRQRRIAYDSTSEHIGEFGSLEEAVNACIEKMKEGPLTLGTRFVSF